VGLVLESATWRASTDWGARLGYSAGTLADVNRRAVEFLVSIREEYATPATPVVLSGCVGPRGDGYVPDARMSAEEAEAHHADQIAAFAASPADLVTAITMTTAQEAIGVARAARRAGMPAVISFTVETDGRLPSGHTLQEAIEEVDAATGAWPAYYMINCAHPSHFEHVLDAGAPWCDRIQGLRANASTRSHAELNEAQDLDEGDPVQLAADYRRLLGRLRRLTVLGGCCGTDHRHIEHIAASCLPLMRLAT
jgi:S-methylmethionine-dependent homocysteine/selenocysteine methylase